MRQAAVDKPNQGDGAHLQKPANRWWRVMDMRIGIVPVPIFIIVLVLLGIYVRLGKVPSDLTTNILTLAVGGLSCAEMEKQLSGLRSVGPAANLWTFVP